MSRKTMKDITAWNHRVDNVYPDRSDMRHVLDLIALEDHFLLNHELGLDYLDSASPEKEEAANIGISLNIIPWRPDVAVTACG